MTKTKRKCGTCNRSKERHLYTADQWKKKSEPVCKSCFKKSDAYRQRLNTRYLRDFGITLEEYEVLLARQGGRCAICNKKPGKRRLAVDHDHEVEELSEVRYSVRGLLCRNCNEYLGHVGDDLWAGIRLAGYLMAGCVNPDNLVK